MERGNVIHHLRQRLAESLTPARYKHVLGVVETSVALARRFGAPVLDAELAAWLHDLAREWPQDRLLAHARDRKLDVPAAWLEAPILLHGPVAADVARVEYGVEDADVLNAVYYHTTGRPGMGELEMVLFVADAIEPSRDYPGVDDIRLLAEKDLKAAALASLESTLRYALDRGFAIDLTTVNARNELLNEVRRKARHSL
ncbi:bis(5'-nucleosyl)-tetraphosphatase (symmetrical) YqeK [Alicyclobacillus mali]|uniref:bis(5'-nucleosyl)-tetraphosphatase (symmetrical) n=1 Tax=Alicyclobacillus mali (ex Roth et al. 2021) TaxID=1123961 RepID=A0ABS0F4J8_9BACL|nr:bis(5'-nucleosyl)-tetraphosphatase (symmetrical) YqeK [Alicyclobacillus mali (ex Roth et al. 2021)]MBF8378231.1 bis(5'-nucleosyl)-tetraphosphatase (symmetrical) YqeK [Alicyclobacillus mali (ex Roth et al. 2021)]MCL6487618.1 bis(5'-nucleosyl)-tetraphosphatase (symmetrical) YqeK [Alicyclobacillus mali (ex Roth et al. 2021)]